MARLTFEVERSPSPYDRNLVLLLLDTSGSMAEMNQSGTTRMAELEAAVARFLDEDVQEIPPLRLNGEIAIGAFSGRGVRWFNLQGGSQDPVFCRVSEVAWQPQLFAADATPMADAIFDAVRILRARRAELAQAGYRLRYLPLVYMVTDGRPSPGQDMQAAQRLLKSSAFSEGKPEFLFVPIGVYGADDLTMRKLAPSYVPLQGAALRDVMRFVTMTASATMRGVDVERSPGTLRTGLPPEYWPIQKILDTFGGYGP